MGRFSEKQAGSLAHPSMEDVEVLKNVIQNFFCIMQHILFPDMQKEHISMGSGIPQGRGVVVLLFLPLVAYSAYNCYKRGLVGATYWYTGFWEGGEG